MAYQIQASTQGRYIVRDAAGKEIGDIVNGTLFNGRAGWSLRLAGRGDLDVQHVLHDDEALSRVIAAHASGEPVPADLARRLATGFRG